MIVIKGGVYLSVSNGSPCFIDMLGKQGTFVPRGPTRVVGVVILLWILANICHMNAPPITGQAWPLIIHSSDNEFCFVRDMSIGARNLAKPYDVNRNDPVSILRMMIRTERQSLMTLILNLDIWSMVAIGPR